ncbi:MAG: hypothetical protein ACRERC_27620 [Candidatus Binatia bacterium]
MSMRAAGLLCGLAGLAALSFGAAPADARPLYFDNFVTKYGITPTDDLYACGVCHRLWTGTGARNPFGAAVEQQLYLSKPILTALEDLEAVDTDLDGFTNLDEITLYGTLPGYSCDTYTLAIDTPPNFQMLITPLVASCLEPKDLNVTPASLGFIAEVNSSRTLQVTLLNNGTDDPITVTSVAFLPAVNPSLSLVADPLPIVIPVGGSSIVDVIFAPLSSFAASGTLRVTSDDPDEPIIDVPITMFAVVTPSASPTDKYACLDVVDRQYQSYAKRHIKEWTRCYIDELKGRACDAGARDLKLQKAEIKLRRFIGGDKDRDCAGNGVTPFLLGLDAICPAPCDHIGVMNFGTFADCLVCTQDASTAAMLDAATGVSPPDMPASLASSGAQACAKSITTAVGKGITKTQKALARCELDNITSMAPVVCTTQLASELADIEAKVTQSVTRCADTTDVGACVFDLMPDPDCLADAASSIGTNLVDLSFGLDP